MTVQNNRPLSPHLGIYKLQVSSGLSILHRITGAALYFGSLLLIWWMAAVVFYPEIVTCGSGSCCMVMMVLLYGWTNALFFHLLNGIRHLFWDMGYGFEINTMNKSGVVVFVGSILLTLCTWIVVLS